MSTTMLVISIIYVIGAIVLTAVVLMQSGKSAGLSGAIAGGMDTFLSKNKAKTWDSKLAKITKWIAIGFLVLTLVLCLFNQ
jgi:preprotein translocase subunit SecG